MRFNNTSRRSSMIKLVSFQGYKDGSTYKSINRLHISRIEDKNQDLLNRCRKVFDKIQPSFTKKAWIKLGIEGSDLNIMKVMYDKPIS
jgi:hypothetical protein